MFFHEKIRSIRPTDKVLEIGPGVSPHFRSNEFLELKFDSYAEQLAQRGGEPHKDKFGARPVHFYDGGPFPFKDNEYDYVICSHVIEHVADPQLFLKEMFRVGSGKGYLEYPLITYEYLYNFNAHLQLLKFNFGSNTLNYLPKASTTLSSFSSVNALLNRSLQNGWDELCANNKSLFFEGFEFLAPFPIVFTSSIDQLSPLVSAVSKKSKTRSIITRVINKLPI